MARRPEPSDQLCPGALRAGVLALDLSSSVGWARADRDAVLAWPGDRPGSLRLGSGQPALIAPLARPAVEYGTLKLGALQSHGHRGNVFDGWLHEQLRDLSPGFVIIEEAIPSHRSRNRAANELALGLRMIAHSAAARHGAVIREVNVVAVKAWLTGRTHAKKPEMMAAAAAMGWPVRTDHEADALAILDLACARSAAATRLFAGCPPAEARPSAGRRAGRSA